MLNNTRQDIESNNIQQQNRRIIKKEERKASLRGLHAPEISAEGKEKF